MKSPGSVLLLGLLLLAQLGGGAPLQRSLDQLQRSTTKPVPQAPSAPAPRPNSVWVPDRYVRDPLDGRMILVPGHTGRTLPGGEIYAPPVTICRESTGVCTTIPAGVRPEIRQAP